MINRMILAGIALSWSAPLLALPAPAAKTVAAPAAAQPSRAAPNTSSGATGTAPAAEAPQPEVPVLVKAQVLLDRTGFSPGVIDGQEGENEKQAAAAWSAANGNADPLATLAASDTRPILTTYTISADDVAGPFVTVPHDFAEMAKLKSLGFSSPLEELAERFHAGQEFLKQLNRGADFGRAGQVITVPNVEPRTLASKVARIEVDKTHQQVRAFDAGGALLALYPATVGSTERPAPKGTWKVIAVAAHPTYTYDPKRLTFGKKREGKLTIAAGPNNPVGSTWIALSKPTYGIHGTPDPALVGKRASHGCVRLTNWDAAQLGKAVERGTTVVFVGTEQRS